MMHRLIQLYESKGSIGELRRGRSSASQLELEPHQLTTTSSDLQAKSCAMASKVVSVRDVRTNDMISWLLI